MPHSRNTYSFFVYFVRIGEHCGVVVQVYVFLKINEHDCLVIQNPSKSMNTVVQLFEIILK